MLPFHEPPPGQYNLLEKPFPGFLGSTSSSSPWSFPFSPSVLHHEEGLHELLFSSPPPNYSTDHPQPPPDPPVNKAVVAINGGAATSRPRRSRSLRKDRHSKIFTAQGPRDRRMRLSLEVARRFFDLQDMLAFDKPSKTVQWLLNQAKSAIKEVESISRPNCQQFSCSSNSTSSSSKSTESSTYESEDVSTISEPKGKLLTRIANEEKVKEKAPKTKRAAVHVVRRATVDPALVRESRTMARARARERTREKKKMRSASLIGSSNEMLAPSAATDQALEESVSDHDLNSSLELVADVDEPSSHTHSTVSEREYGFLAMTSEPGHAQDFDVSFLHEQWGMHFTGNTTTDEQVHAKQWFFNNNGSNLFQM
ncbi:hypothetical protein J5N97_019586 [Dioscorea zingiberensis]|uniref:Uncharacterized protein n=1 Tax=Dioscorea zingiberensis TaxID=325984 RepID=A0A9D5HCV4_9LILI|nr:hypothetical protein J5N97_019586 [Dioscorea zingiberensis]